MSNNPLVSVIMPVYNSENYVAEAIESILKQSYVNFEFLIFDDCSVDNSVLIIKDFHDSRIKLITKPKNTGYTKSLNLGLKLAKGKYIARMDSDDIASLNRFQEQVNFMESNANVDVCGSWFTIMGSDNIIKHPENHEDIKIALLYYCAIGHPTVMIRAQMMKDNNLFYDPSFEPAEDYNLWAKISMVGRLHNLQKSLLNYRVHEKQVSIIFKQGQSAISNDIRIIMLNNLIDSQISYNFFEINEDTDRILSASLKNRFKLIKKLENGNNKLEVFNPVMFHSFLNNLKRNLINQFLVRRNAFTPRVFVSTIGLLFINRSLIGERAIIKYFLKSIYISK